MMTINIQREALVNSTMNPYLPPSQDWEENLFSNLWESSLGSSSSSRSSLWSAVVACLAVSALREEAAEGLFTGPPRPPRPLWSHRASIRPPIRYSRLEWFLHPQPTSLHLNTSSTQTSTS